MNKIHRSIAALVLVLVGLIDCHDGIGEAVSE